MQLHTEVCMPCQNACLDIQIVIYIHRVHAGYLASESTIRTRLSVLEPLVSTSAIRDIINHTTCHAVLVSAEVRFPDCHGIVLQVSTETKPHDLQARLVHADATQLLLQELMLAYDAAK